VTESLHGNVSENDGDERTSATKRREDNASHKEKRENGKSEQALRNRIPE
jgi:hypothetical protein